MAYVLFALLSVFRNEFIELETLSYENDINLQE